MLHGFLTKTVKDPESDDDIAAGTELFAFMPSAVMTENLRKYATDHDYQHRYFVDGEITVAEVFVSGAWKTVLVGTLGRGGKSVFALDVTDPFDVSLLWEKTVSDIPALGNTLGKPIIAEVGSGFDDDPGQSDWRVLLGNGPNSSGDRAQLISISLVDGSVKTYDTGVGGDNGLSAVLVWDADKDGFFETVYAGDLRGNLWRFSDLGTAAPPEPFKLFTTAGNRPVTAAPWAAVNQRDGRTWIFVGTGQYLNEDDRSSLVTESWYGLIDDRSALNPGTTIGSRETSLVKRNILKTGTLPTGPDEVRGARTLDIGNESEVSAEGKRGWYIDFNQPGERMITPNSFYGNALIGTTFIPDGTDLCKPGGRSALWGINPFTGGRLSKALFDFNHDGTFDDKLDGLFPSVMDNLRPILVGVPPITIKEDGDRRIVVMHTDPDNSEEFRPPSGDAQAQSWREVLGE
jgi:type IV pilus assembly protein PilY1